MSSSASGLGVEIIGNSLPLLAVSGNPQNGGQPVGENTPVKEVAKNDVLLPTKCQSYFRCEVLKILDHALEASMARMKKCSPREPEFLCVSSRNKENKMKECLANLCDYCCRKYKRDEVIAKENVARVAANNNVCLGRFNAAVRACRSPNEPTLGTHHDLKRFLRRKTYDILTRTKFYSIFTDMNVELLYTFRQFANFIVQNSYQVDPLFVRGVIQNKRHR
uniref:Uncharacterized protein n=1 Tax=Rhabditophanes sp. KR3021 TaxID=114890 RepID=A0AC35TZP4_9BILA